jgi:hypothetical protein
MWCHDRLLHRQIYVTASFTPLVGELLSAMSPLSPLLSYSPLHSSSSFIPLTGELLRSRRGESPSPSALLFLLYPAGRCAPKSQAW